MSETIPAPSAPWCRIHGRVVAPDASAHGVAAQVVLDPDAERPTATLPDGRVLVASRVVCSTDATGRLVHDDGSGEHPWVDVIAPGDGVTPTGEWTYSLVVTVPGRGGDRWVRHVTLTQGAVVDLVDLAPAASYAGDALTIAESAAAAAARSAQDAATALERAEADIAAGLTKGDTGTGVVSILDEDRDGVATVTLTDGSTGSLPLPPGPQGDPGVGVASITNPDGDAQALVTLTDGTTQDLVLPTVTPPTFTAEASALAAGAAPTADVTGTYPDLTIALGVPEGAPGQDAVNPQFTASASTLAAGASATASVTGTYPDLTLSLGIPRGATGATGAPGAIGTASTYMLVGPGRPDVASTTGGVITGSEPVGAVFHSTDGASVGAWSWQRTPTGWVVTMGDTGWRDVSNLLVSPWTTSTIRLCRIRRLNMTSFLHIQYDAKPVPSGDVFVMPAGFRGRGGGVNAGIASASIVGQYNNMPIGSGITAYQNINSTHTVRTNGASEGGVSALTWATDDTWPTTLPGSPA